MLIKSRKRSVISLVMFVAVIAWPITGLSCGTGYKQYIIGGTATCVQIVSNGVDADITLESGLNWSTDNTISSFGLTVSPTSPLACGGKRDDDCDDIKEARYEEKTEKEKNKNKKSKNAAAVPATVAPAAVVPIPPSGLISCTLPALPGDNLADDFNLVNVPGTTVISTFQGLSSQKPSGADWIIKSSPVTDTSTTTGLAIYNTLASICQTAYATTPSYVSNPGYSSTPTDFVPCNLNSVVKATPVIGTSAPTTLTCALPANQCSGILTDRPLVIDDNGLIGVQLLTTPNTDSDGSPIIEALPYSCQ